MAKAAPKAKPFEKKRDDADGATDMSKTKSAPDKKPGSGSGPHSSHMPGC